MAKKIMLSCLVILLFAVFITCHKPMVISDDGPIKATAYIKDHGYKIIEYRDQHEFLYTRQNLHWSDVEIFFLMNADIEDYMSKPLIFDKFVVTDHPLDNDFDRLKNSIHHRFETRFPNKTYIITVSFQDEVIGGYSFSYETGAKLLGFDCRDIDGERLEEHMNISKDACFELLNKTYRRLKGI